ncbi:hypothetical protein POAN111098_10040 [Polynucleobacter antarcticus]
MLSSGFTGYLLAQPSACSGTGNVLLYGPNASTAGLPYSINTRTNVLQGVSVFKL